MKRTLLFGLLFLSSLAYGQNGGMPSYSQVLQDFFSRYNTDNRMLRFEKRPEGWKIRCMDTDSSWLYWSSQTGTYESLPWDSLQEARSPHESDNYTDLQFEADARWFRAFPVFGYRGWYLDAIEQLEREANPTPPQQFLLARAHQQAARSLLLPVHTYVATSLMFPWQDGYLSPDQLELYLMHSQAAWEGYRKLLKDHPGYKPHFPPLATRGLDNWHQLGDLRTFYSNSLMTAWLDLWMFGAHESVEAAILEAPLYDPFLLQYARHLLENCPPNTLLFTAGDNDTYPLLYLQLKEGLRRDVQVINIWMLGLGPFLHALQHREVKGTLRFQLTADQYLAERCEAIFLRNAIEKEGDKRLLGRMFEEVVLPRNYFEVWGQEQYSIPFRKWKWPITLPLVKSAAAPLAGYPALDTLRLDFWVNSTLPRNQLAWLDLVYSNAEYRPVCLTLGIDRVHLIDWQDQFFQTGLVRRFSMSTDTTRTLANMIRGNFPDIATEVSERQWSLRRFDALPGKNPAHTLPLEHYLGECLGIGEQYRKAGKDSLAAHWLNQYRRTFPESVDPPGHHHIPLVDAYLANGLYEQAQALAQKILQHLPPISQFSELTQLHRTTLVELEEVADQKGYSLLSKLVQDYWDQLEY